MNKNNRDQVSEAERLEAATLESVGELKFEGEGEQRNVPLSHFPSGADGTEPAKPVSEEVRQKLEQSVVRQRQKLTQIADIALAAEAKSNTADVRLGSKYMENSKAIAEIRRICKESFVEEVVPDYEWLAKIMTGEHFEPECLAKAIEAEASKRPIEYPTFYTQGWLCELAKRLQGNQNANLRESGESTRMPVREDSPNSPNSRSEALVPLKKRCANTPRTIVFEIVRPFGMKLSAEWEAESTGHSAQAFLYKDEKCVCQIRFFNDFQTRNLGRQITKGALNTLSSVVGHTARWRRNRAQKEVK